MKRKILVVLIATAIVLNLGFLVGCGASVNGTWYQATSSDKTMELSISGEKWSWSNEYGRTVDSGTVKKDGSIYVFTGRNVNDTGTLTSGGKTLVLSGRSVWYKSKAEAIKNR